MSGSHNLGTMADGELKSLRNKIDAEMEVRSFLKYLNMLAMMILETTPYPYVPATNDSKKDYKAAQEQSVTGYAPATGGACEPCNCSKCHCYTAEQGTATAEAKAESKADSGAQYGSATISSEPGYGLRHSTVIPEELSQDEKDYYLDTLVTKAYMFDMVTGLLEVPSDTIGGIQFTLRKSLLVNHKRGLDGTHFFDVVAPCDVHETAKNLMLRHVMASEHSLNLYRELVKAHDSRRA